MLTHDTVIFDLGNTLVSYYDRPEWPSILEQAMKEVTAYLRDERLLHVALEQLPARVSTERGERDDYRVNPLEERLARIFDLSETEAPQHILTEMSRRFLRPIFARARLHEDVPPVLQELRQRGVRTGILSNAPWSSPAGLWREELARHGLLTSVDAVVFCRDAGYRKPARQAFEFIMSKLGVPAQGCLFVGDDPRWDVAGPRAVGMDAVLIDRAGRGDGSSDPVIRDLGALLR
jgi:putative hydrolase of the HAD superfamily